MRTLVLGGTHHVGRAVVESALARGDEVVTVNRGETGTDNPAVDARRADRLEEGSLAEALGGDEFDAVIDTWSAEPFAVRDAAWLLSGRVGHFTYVSSRSVFTWPIPPGADESAPVVDGDPDGVDRSDYAAAKRGGELAVERDFDGPFVLARAGLILGPYELVGRLPFWLTRVQRGGRIPAPGPQDRPLQYVDCRDLADWVLTRPVGTFNTVSEPGHATIGQVLAECVRVTGSDGELVWLDPEVVERAEVDGWTELPIWVPPTGELAALHDGDVSAALAAGLTCRPIAETVAATWQWLRDEGLPPQVAARPATGLSEEAEARLWAAYDA